MSLQNRFSFKKQEFVSYTVFYCYDHQYQALDVIIHDPCNIAALLDLRCTRSLNISFEDAFSGISAEQLKESSFNEYYQAVNTFHHKWESNRSRIIASGIEVLNDKMNHHR